RTNAPKYSYFFFQAEDGIRDFHVTGVQTCALPICDRGPAHGLLEREPVEPRREEPGVEAVARARRVDNVEHETGRTHDSAVGTRSEERREGKEGRPERTTQE